MPERPNPSLSAKSIICFHIVTGAPKSQGAMNPSISSLGRNFLFKQLKTEMDRTGAKPAWLAARPWTGAVETRLDGDLSAARGRMLVNRGVARTRDSRDGNGFSPAAGSENFDGIHLPVASSE
jgi:hypothetical protein